MIYKISISAASNLEKKIWTYIFKQLGLHSSTTNISLYYSCSPCPLPVKKLTAVLKSSKLSGHLLLTDSEDPLIVSSCPKLKSGQQDAESSAKTSEAEVTYWKIHGPVQVGRSDLGSSKELVIPNKKSHAYRSLISSISKELSEDEITLRACKLQLQCSWTLWENYVKNNLFLKSILAMSPYLLSVCLATTHVLPSPSNLLWWHLSEESSCFLCKKQHCTLIRAHSRSL